MAGNVTLQNAAGMACELSSGALMQRRSRDGMLHATLQRRGIGICSASCHGDFIEWWTVEGGGMLASPLKLLRTGPNFEVLARDGLKWQRGPSASRTRALIGV